MSPHERRALPCIGRERADLVVAGCAILETILDLWPADRLGVADRGIREGILRSLMAAEREAERTPRRAAANQTPRGPAMSRSGTRSGERLRTAKKRTRSSARWLDAAAQRSLRQAGQGRRLSQPRGLQADGARREVRPAQEAPTRVVDLGIAPGGWSQVVREVRPRAASSGSTCCRPNRLRA